MIYDVTNVDSFLFITIDKHSSLQKLLRVMVYCLKFIYIKIIQKCNLETRVRIFRKHKLLEKIFANMVADSIYSREIKSAILLWTFVIQHRRIPDVFVAIEKHRKNCLETIGSQFR